MSKLIYIYMFILLVFFATCKKDPAIYVENIYNPAPYKLTYPTGVLPPNIPAENPLTVEGVELGRRLFYDKKLSGDNTMSCASCHGQAFAFTDNNNQFSKGITNEFGKRNAMPIFNLAWEKTFFWDGGAPNLESQIVGPLTSPIEMHSSFADVVEKLKADPIYPKMFKKAFGKDTITSAYIMRAIAQFERSIVSFNSLFDRTYKTQKQREYALQNPITRLDSGFLVFALDSSPSRPNLRPGHCWHCHGLSPSTALFTDLSFHNNGLEDVYVDSGRMRITYNEIDRGFFKTPTLRNLSFTAPYMHDGRFKKLEEVIEHYSSGVHYLNNKDGITRNDFSRPLKLNARDKENLKIFLLSLSDSSLLYEEKYKSPF